MIYFIYPLGHTKLFTNESRFNTVNVWRSINAVLLKAVLTYLSNGYPDLKKSLLNALDVARHGPILIHLFKKIFHVTFSKKRKTKKQKIENHEQKPHLRNPYTFHDNLKNYGIIILLTKFLHFWVFLKLMLA